MFGSLWDRFFSSWKRDWHLWGCWISPVLNCETLQWREAENYVISQNRCTCFTTTQVGKIKKEIVATTQREPPRHATRAAVRCDDPHGGRNGEKDMNTALRWTADINDMKGNKKKPKLTEREERWEQQQRQHWHTKARTELLCSLVLCCLAIHAYVMQPDPVHLHVPHPPSMAWDAVLHTSST